VIGLARRNRQIAVVSAHASGATRNEAVREIGDAIEAWIAACRAAGDPVPEPTTKARQAA